MIITTFRGEVPKQYSRKGSVAYASYALDVNLARGTLDPWGAPIAVASVGSDKTFYLDGCGVYSWADCVDVAKSGPNYARFFITGRKDYPEVAIVKDEKLEYYRLGVPRPESILSFSTTHGEAMSESTDARDYVYTYVNLFGEEGAPSMATASIKVVDGTAVGLVGFIAPPLEYGVVSIRLYRAATSERSVGDKIEADTHRLLVIELPIYTTAYTDTILMDALGQAVETYDTAEPPQALNGIHIVETTEILTGFVGNELYFSTPLLYSDWRYYLALTLDENIVALTSALGDLYVATNGRPYYISGAEPCDDKPRDVVPLAHVMPMVSCSSRGMISTPYGALYVSAEGIVLLNGDKPPQVITKDVWSVTQWEKLHPESMILGYHKGSLIIATAEETYVVPLDTALYGTAEAFMTRASIRPEQMQRTNNDEMVYLEEGVVRHWDAGEPRPFHWVTETTAYPAGVTVLRKKSTSAGVVSVNLSNATHFKSQVTKELTTENWERVGRIGRAATLLIDVQASVEVVELGVSNTVIGATAIAAKTI